jgi:hypothetical protein
MAKSTKFVCHEEHEDRSKAFELLQEVGRLIRSQRHQFTMTKEAKPEGGFVFTIETNGFKVQDAVPPKVEAKASKADEKKAEQAKS